PGRQVDKGLLVRLQYAITKTQRRPLDNVLGVCRNIYESAKSISEGRIWNAFNYAVLMDALDNVDIAEKCYLETLECMNGADDAAFYGTPVFIIGEEWYQEFNLFEYRHNSHDIKKKLLTSVVLTRLAQIFVNKGRRSEAEKLFKRAIDFYPQNTEANYWYGLLSSSTQQLIGYRYLKIAYEQNSFDHRYWNSLISAANGAGRTSESESFKREMRILKPLAESVYGQSDLMF
ncbi:MAG: hypothetical protein JNL74_23940, partial [Fibrobacteres bacterium]|nr:hypothetical protein [Fibrobacterota bacterium]